MKTDLCITRKKLNHTQQYVLWCQYCMHYVMNVQATISGIKVVWEKVVK